MLRTANWSCICLARPIAHIAPASTRNLFTIAELTKKKREYSRKELVGYSMQQMYDVVSDVNNYKSFVPYCKKSNLYDQTKTRAKAEMVVGFPPLVESYRSDLTFNEPFLVKAECTDGFLFNYLLNYWGFSPGVRDVAQSSVIDFRVTFEFKSALHSQLSHLFFDLIVQQMESAFLDEARRRYGPPAVPSHLISVVKS